MVALKNRKLRSTYERFKSEIKSGIFITRGKSKEKVARKMIQIASDYERNSNKQQTKRRNKWRIKSGRKS